MHEIKIYGEIIPFEDAWIIEQGGYVNLTSVQNQLKEAEGKDIKVRINSCGGDCDTGFAIYAELRRYAKENNAKVETFGEARVASIATVIFLAGDTRTLTEHTEPFVHNAWTYEIGDSKRLLRAAADLEKWNQKIAEHYANHTNLTVEEALELMENETSITTEEAKEMRFATDIEEVFRPAAMQRFKNQKPNDDMTNNKAKIAFAKAAKFIENAATALGIATGVLNKIVYTADEKELDFYELGEDDPIEVGAKANFDGAAAEGSFVMQSGETYVFAAGELTEIIEAVEEEDVEVLKAERDALAEQLEAVTNKAEELVTANASLNEQLAKFKNARSQAPAQPIKTKPTAQEPDETDLDTAVANLKTIKLK